MALELAADGAAVKEQRIERHAGEPEPQPVEHGDEAHRLDLDPGLFLHLFDYHLGGGIAHITPTGRVQPDTRVGALDQQQLALVVADRRPHRHFGGHIARHPLADGGEPLVHKPLGIDRRSVAVVGLDGDVGRDFEDLFEALLFIEALGEAEPGAARWPKGSRSTAAVS